MAIIVGEWQECEMVPHTTRAAGEYSFFFFHLPTGRNGPYPRASYVHLKFIPGSRKVILVYSVSKEGGGQG